MVPVDLSWEFLIDRVEILDGHKICNAVFETVESGLRGVGVDLCRVELQQTDGAPQCAFGGRIRVSLRELVHPSVTSIFHFNPNFSPVP